MKHRPVMLHRAILGSLERFVGVLIEHYAGAFPLWLAPVQAVVATITQDADDYAGDVAAKLRKAGLRVETLTCATRRSATRSANTPSPRSRSSLSSAAGRPRKVKSRSADWGRRRRKW